MLLVGFTQRYLLTTALIWVFLILCLIGFVRSRSWRSRRPVVRIAAKWMLALWTLAFFSVAMETAFALGYCTTDAFSLSLVSKRWYERFVNRNNWECRDDKPYRGEQPSNVKRLTIVGDSFAFGHGIARPADRFGNLLNARLQAVAPKRWEVYNLAEPGAGTGWEVERLDELRRTKQFHTDAVLLAYCLNDLEDLVPSTYEIVGSIINNPPKNYVLTEFFLPNFLYYRLNHFRRPEVRGYFNWLKDGYTGEIWAKQRARLDEIKRWCKEENAQLLVAVFPFFGDLGDTYPFEEAHRTLINYFHENGVAAIDLLPVLRPHREEGLTVNPFDAHPNERAHRIAAAAIWEKLVEPRLKPAAKHP